MDVNEITKMLDSIPTGRSRFEFENFFLERYQTTARQLVETMLEIERLHSQKASLGAISKKADDGQKIQNHRIINEITSKLSQLESWYNGIDPEMRMAILSQYEEQETEYWTNYLGRQAAIELLTIGRSSKDTMDRMANLPVEAYEEAVRICIRFAAMIKETTATVEQNMGIFVSNLPKNQ